MATIWQEIVGDTNRAINDISQQMNEPGFFDMVLGSLTAEATTGVLPSGQRYSTAAVLNQGAPAAPASAAGRPVGQPNGMSQEMLIKQLAALRGGSPPEQSVDNATKIVSALFGYVASPLYAVADRLALATGVIKTPQELFGQDLAETMALAAAAQTVKTAIRTTPEMQAVVNQLSLAVLAQLEAPKQNDLRGGEVEPSDGEHSQALTLAKQIVDQAATEVGSSCPYCGQRSIGVSCNCGGSREIAQNSAKASSRRLGTSFAQLAHEKNKQLTTKAITHELATAEQQRLVANVFERNRQNETKILLDIPPSTLIMGALLGDITLLPQALWASLFPSETGKRGMQVMFVTGDTAGGAPVLAIAGAGQPSGINKLPADSYPEWKAKPWQGIVSDTKLGKWLMTKVLGATHIPEIGTLSLVNPRQIKDRADIPFAVRYESDKKPMTGGAGAYSSASQMIQRIMQIVQIAPPILDTPDGPPPTQQVSMQRAVEAGARELREKGVRPQVVANLASQIAQTMIDQNSVILPPPQPTESTIDPASLVAGHLKSYQNADAYLEARRSGQTFYLGEGEHIAVVVRNSDPPIVIDPRVVDQIQVSGEQFPAEWEVRKIPPPHQIRDIAQTAITEIASLDLSGADWSRLLSGAVQIEGVSHDTLVEVYQKAQNLKTASGSNAITAPSPRGRLGDTVKVMRAILSKPPKTPGI